MDMPEKISSNLFVMSDINSIFVLSIDMIFKNFKLIINIYKDYACSKSKWSQFFFTHMNAYILLLK